MSLLQNTFCNPRSRVQEINVAKKSKLVFFHEPWTHQPGGTPSPPVLCEVPESFCHVRALPGRRSWHVPFPSSASTLKHVSLCGLAGDLLETVWYRFCAPSSPPALPSWRTLLCYRCQQLRVGSEISSPDISELFSIHVYGFLMWIPRTLLQETRCDILSPNRNSLTVVGTRTLECSVLASVTWTSVDLSCISSTVIVHFSSGELLYGRFICIRWDLLISGKLSIWKQSQWSIKLILRKRRHWLSQVTHWRV